MISGQCLCGDVKYEIDGKISPIWLCHCGKCRKMTGSAFHASAVCGPDELRWLSGEEGIREYVDTPGYKVRFCGRCSAPVPTLLEEFGLWFLHAGSLNEDTGRSVDHHIFVGSKASWYEVLDDRPQFDEHRPRE